jgi:hypothetical protein
MSVSQVCDRGLIFGLIHLRSFGLIGIQINVEMHVTNAGVTWRTIIPTPENRKVQGSTPVAISD